MLVIFTINTYYNTVLGLNGPMTHYNKLNTSTASPVSTIPVNDGLVVGQLSTGVHKVLQTCDGDDAGGRGSVSRATRGVHLLDVARERQTAMVGSSEAVHIRSSNPSEVSHLATHQQS